MFALEVRDHMMIAHSLPRPVFGPAQGLHGATFIVDVAFFRPELDADNLVVDIGLASVALKKILSPLTYQNLDSVPELAGKITTTEFLARYIFDQMCAAVQAGDLGPHAGGLTKIRVSLEESHIARAWYEGALA
ncbi:6-pyruvoyl tetrahydropterin synthase [Elstera litoralis]|uniref:6-carboxy-5,6,7,8-tetrahydropterin synthase n=1 Tax=Elstera litoralis TaxID=552518 RepID=A0A0F3INX9_9PROT|nr:6-carboxytetrahydropterin synthase [Elstera litoralis]KJV08435.1 6-pyruvoyl tetrahydropterin synthase [Elstera litoralis]